MPSRKAYSGISVEAHATMTFKLKYNSEWPLAVECSRSTLRFGTLNEGSATKTVKAQIESLTFELCNCEVLTITGGNLEIHWISGTHNGTLASSGLLLAFRYSTIFGSIHYEYTTSATDIGTITGGLLERIHISVPLSRVITNALCGAEGKLEGEYERESPGLLYVAKHT